MGHPNSRSSSILDINQQDQQHKMLGNKSKDAKSWINGPTHEIRNQCLPGYTGFIPGVKAENVFSTTYAINTAKSFANKIAVGLISFTIFTIYEYFDKIRNFILLIRQASKLIL